MTVDEIKQAVNEGKTVCWQHAGYRVVPDKMGGYLIKCLQNNHCIGLTRADGRMLNGAPREFFIEPVVSNLRRLDMFALVIKHDNQTYTYFTASMGEVRQLSDPFDNGDADGEYEIYRLDREDIDYPSRWVSIG